MGGLTLSVDGDPVANISDIRRVRTTFKGGKVYDSAALFREVGVLPAPLEQRR